MFLENLQFLMRINHLNNHTLSQASGVPYTTIDAFFKKGCDNVKLSTLQRLANYFGVSLDYLVNGDSTTLTRHEFSVLSAYRQNPAMQPAVDKLLGVEDVPSPSESQNVSDDMATELSEALKKSTVLK